MSTSDHSFSYTANPAGFTAADLEAVLKGTDLENEDIKNVLFHCTNPGIVGHPKLCSNGCKDPAQEGSHKCDG